MLPGLASSRRMRRRRRKGNKSRRTSSEAFLGWWLLAAEGLRRRSAEQEAVRDASRGAARREPWGQYSWATLVAGAVTFIMLKHLECWVSMK